MSAVLTTTGRNLPAAAEGDRSRAIFGIRGLAAVALLTVHVAIFAGLLGTRVLDPPQPPSNPVGAFFVSGLPSFIGVFFVLPALFLYLPFAKAVISGKPRPPAGKRLVRRLIRLLPAYYALYLVVLLALNRDAIDGLWYVLRPILLLQVYTPSPFVPQFMNGMEITWSVPSMVQWYLALPLIAWAVHRFAERGETPLARARRLMLPVPILITAGIGWLFFVKAQGWDNRIVFWWPQGFAPAIGIGMGLAILVALSQVSPGDTSRLLRTAAARPHLFWIGAVAVYLVNCARPFSVIGMDAIYTVSGLLITYLMVAMFGLLASVPLISGGRQPRLIEQVLTNGLVVHLGRVSYGIYLWHFAVMHFYLQPERILSGDARPIREFYGQVGFWELEAVTLIGAAIIATLSYYLLERPIASWADQRLRDRPPGRRGPGTSLVPRPAAGPTVAIGPAVAAGGGMAAEEATTAVANAAAERDTIRANIVELERSFGRQLLASGNLAGQTKQRWASSTADLAALWSVFTAYSAVVDDAIQTLASRHRPTAADLAKVTSLLTETSVVLTHPPTPLIQRHITDDGRIRLTVPAAVERMHQLFRGTAELVTTVETIWNQLTQPLDQLSADLARAEREPVGPPLAPAVATAREDIQRLFNLLNTDPLALWEQGRADPELSRLRQQVTDILAGQAGPDHRLSAGAGPAERPDG